MLPLLSLKSERLQSRGQPDPPLRSDVSEHRPPCTNNATHLANQIADLSVEPTDVNMSRQKRTEPGTDQPTKAAKSPSVPDFITVSKLGAAQGQTIRGVTKAEQSIAGVTDETLKAVEGVQLLVTQGVCPALKGGFTNEKGFSGRDDLRRDITLFEGETFYDGWNRLLRNHLDIPSDMARDLILVAENELTTRSHLIGSRYSTHSTVESHISHDGAGDECKFRILSMGAWARTDESGNTIDTQLQKWCMEGTDVTTGQLFFALRDIQKEFDGTGSGQWCLSSNKWVLAGKSGPAPADGREPNVDVCTTASVGNPRAYNLDAGKGQPWRVILPDSGPAGFLRVDNADYIEWLKGTIATDSIKMTQQTPEQSALDAAKAVAFYKQLSAGPLKSSMQKLVRFNAQSVELPDGSNVPAIVCAMAALGICFTNRGDEFIPDLSLFVRGPTAALKRLGVIMIEDAWPKGDGEKVSGMLAAIMASSLATLRLPSWSPPLELVRVTLLTIGACVRSDRVLAWRKEQANSPPLQMNKPPNLGHMRMAADFLRVLRSFDGDMNMFDKVAGMTRASNGLKTYVDASAVITFNKNTAGQHALMPWYHMIDQHVYRGIGFACWSMESDSQTAAWTQPFGPRHKQVFERVTGFNPRLQNAKIDETAADVMEARFAQRLVGEFVTSEVGVNVAAAPQPLGDEQGASAMDVDVEAPESIQKVVMLDYGVLSGGAELILVTVKTSADEDEKDDLGLTSGTTWKLQVILGIATAEEQVINAPAGRKSLEDAGLPPSNTAIRRAVAEVRSKQAGYKFKSPVLPGYNVVKYETNPDGSQGWTVKGGSGKPDILWKYGDNPTGLFNTTTLIIHQIASPDWLANEQQQHGNVHAKLMDDAFALECTKIRDSSRCVVRANWEQAIEHIVHQLDKRQSQRLLATIRGQFTTLKMATPDIKGGAPSDGPAPSGGDWRVYRALLLISYLCPGALTPKQVPNFIINNALLLREIEVVLARRVVATPVEAVRAEWEPWREKASKLFIKQSEDYPYQRPLIDLMLKRDSDAVVQTPAHFLRLRVAAGKTVLGLWYAMEFAAKTGAAKRILWLTVKEAIGDHAKQFRDFGFGDLVYHWDITNTKANAHRSPPPASSKIVMVTHESFSLNKDQEPIQVLMKWAITNAPDSIVVVDEVHRLFATGTSKGANIRRIVELAPKSVYATAIPPVKTKSALLAPYWLRDAVAFPAQVETVACASLVVAAVKPPYDSRTAYEGFDLSPGQQAQWLQAVKEVDEQRKRATKEAGNAWNKLYKVATGFCEERLIAMAVEMARRDRAVLLADGTRPFATGGCCVCAETRDAAIALAGKIQTHVNTTQGEQFRVVARTDETYDKDGTVGISVINFKEAAGFNLIRYGFWISTPHPSSMATRIQIKGRIDRLAAQIHQKEKNGGSLHYTWLYPKHTILESLLINHSSADGKAEKLDQLAEKYASNFKAK